MQLDYTHSIVIGDWSGDGHDRKEKYVFRATHDRDDIINGYKRAAQTIGLALEDESPGIRAILHRYEDQYISATDQATLANAGIDLTLLSEYEEAESDMELWLTPSDVAVLFLEFVRSQTPGFKYEIVDAPRSINGYWQDDFNVHIGYGVFV